MADLRQLELRAADLERRVARLRERMHFLVRQVPGGGSLTKDGFHLDILTCYHVEYEGDGYTPIFTPVPTFSTLFNHNNAWNDE